MHMHTRALEVLVYEYIYYMYRSQIDDSWLTVTVLYFALSLINSNPYVGFNRCITLVDISLARVVVLIITVAFVLLP